MIRPTWDEWGLALARAAATRADCTRRQVGAVIVDPDRRVVATGYNGAPAGEKGCLTASACPRGQMSVEAVEPGSSYDTGAGACIALHAEQNAIIRASWAEMKYATLYVTDEPCDGCMRMIKGTPISRIVTPVRVPPEYALLLKDGTLVKDPGWHCEADVMAGFAAFGARAVYGALVRRRPGDEAWETVRPDPTLKEASSGQ